MPFALCVKTVVSYNISLDLNKFLAILFCKRIIDLYINQKINIVDGWFGFLDKLKDYDGGGDGDYASIEEDLEWCLLGAQDMILFLVLQNK